MPEVLDQMTIPGHRLDRVQAAGPNGAVLLATNLKTNARVLIKTFQPVLLFDTPEDRADIVRRTEAFTASATLQQAMSQVSRGWAPIEAQGLYNLSQPDGVPGAYYVSTPFPASVEWLIRGQVNVRAATLHHIITGIYQALLSMRSKFNRAHGNLSPTNVLLTDRDLAKSQVVLTDPAATAFDDFDESAPNDADDRYAIGCLIYELITNHQVRRMMLLPIEITPDWQALGRHAKRWLALCNQLLARERASRPSWEAIGVELRRLRPVDTAKLIRRAGVAAGVSAVCAVAGLWMYKAKYRAACEQMESDRPWVLAMIKANENDSEFRSVMENDPTLPRDMQTQLAVLAPVMEMDPADRPWLPRLDQFHQARKGPAALAALKSDFSCRHWSRRDQVMLLIAEVLPQTRDLDPGFPGVAEDLTDLLKNLPPSGGSRSWGALKHFEQRMAGLQTQWTALSKQWGEIEQLDRKINTINNEQEDVERRPARDLSGLLMAGARETAALSENNRLQDFENAMVRLSVFENSPSANYLSLETAVGKAFGQADPPAVVTVLQTMHDNLPRDLADSHAYQNLLTARNHVNNQLKLISPAYFLEPALEGQMVGINEAINSIKGPFPPSAENELDERCQPIELNCRNLTADLDQAYSRSQVDNWLLAMQSRCTGESFANPAWQAVLRKLRGGDMVAGMSADPAVFAMEQRAITRWQAFMPLLQKEVEKQAKLPEGYTAVEAVRRLQLWNALSINSREMPPEKPDAMVSSACASVPWWDQTREFAEDFPQAGRSLVDLTAWDALAAKWISPAKSDDSRQAFWVTQATAAAGVFAKLGWLKNQTDCLTDYENVKKVGELEWRKVCVNSKPDFHTLASGLKLLNTRWPATAEEIGLAGKWFTAVAKMNLPADDQVQLQKLRQKTWLRAIAKPARPDVIGTAVHLAKGFNVYDINAAVQGDAYATYNLLILTGRSQHSLSRAAVAKAAAQLQKSDQVTLLPLLHSIQPNWSPAEVAQVIDDDSWYHLDGRLFSPILQSVKTAKSKDASGVNNVRDVSNNEGSAKKKRRNPGDPDDPTTNTP